MKEVEKDSDEGDGNKNHNSNDGNGNHDDNKNYNYLSHKNIKLILERARCVHVRAVHTYTCSRAYARTYLAWRILGQGSRLCCTSKSTLT